MQLVPQFDPTTATSGSFALNTPNGGWLVLTNESVIGLLLTFGDGSKALVHPFTVRALRVPVRQVGCDWQQAYSITGAQAPQGLNIVTGETYDPAEWSGGEFILSLPRLVNVGNPTSGASVSATVVNDGNAPGTQVIEMTATGSPTSNVVIDNDGTIHIKVLSNGSYIEALAIVPGTASTPATLTLASAAFTGDISTSGGVTVTGNASVGGFMLLGPAVSGGRTQFFYSTGINALQFNTPQAGGVAQGVAFGTWDGAAGHVPFSIGGRFNGALAWVDNSGNYAGLAGIGIPTTRDGTATSVPIYTGTNAPFNPPTGSIWIKA